MIWGNIIVRMAGPIGCAIKARYNPAGRTAPDWIRRLQRLNPYPWQVAQANGKTKSK